MKYDTPEELSEAVEAYFAGCKESGAIPTMSGMAVALGTNRQTIKNYRDREDFAEIINFARSRVEAEIEQQLFIGRNAVGPIFNLKNNFGWKDERVQEHKGELGVRSVTVRGTGDSNS